MIWQAAGTCPSCILQSFSRLQVIYWLVLCVGPENLEQVLSTVVEAAVELSDPVAQKLCFAILRKLIELWGTLSFSVLLATAILQPL